MIFYPDGAESRVDSMSFHLWLQSLPLFMVKSIKPPPATVTEEVMALRLMGLKTRGQAVLPTGSVVGKMC